MSEVAVVVVGWCRFVLLPTENAPEHQWCSVRTAIEIDVNVATGTADPAATARRPDLMSNTLSCCPTEVLMVPCASLITWPIHL